MADLRLRWLSNREQSLHRGSVNNEVPEVSVLRPVLFMIYINDLDSGVRNWKLKFADDSKIFSKINNAEDGIRLHDDMYRL